MSRALVLGGASCLWDDLRAYGPPDGLIVAVNDAIWAYPHPIDHAVTLHTEHIEAWLERRRRKGLSADVPVWSNKDHPSVTHRHANWGAGSSGMLGMVVALEALGCDEVVLCGIPMDPRPHFHNAEGWHGAATHSRAWTRNVDRMRGRVWSMSGWTRELLGSPPWLLGAQDAA